MANEKRLTEKDKIAYYAIEKFIKENGYPPTVRELCRILGKVSTATVHYRLKSLKQKGYITATDGANRTIRLMKEIEYAPTVSAVEVVHAKWKYYHKQNIAVCTNCSFERNLDADFGRAISCPNCGAKMDGGNEDAER